MMAASNYGKLDTAQETFEYTDEEKAFIPVVESIWKNILNMDIENNTHFFQSGAGSMDVVRYITNNIVIISLKFNEHFCVYDNID